MELPVQLSHGEKMDAASNIIPVLFLALILTAFFTGVISAALLALYRRSVLRAMKKQAPAQASPRIAESDSVSPVPANTPPLEFNYSNAKTSIPTPKSDAFYLKLKTVAKKRVRIYALAGLGYAFVMSLFYFIANQIKFLPLRFLVTLWLFFFPVLFSIHLIIFYDKRLRRRFPLGYFLIYLIIIFMATFPDWENMIPAFSVFIWINAIPLVLSVVFLNRYTKVVAPLIMSFVFFVVIGIILAFTYGLDPLAETLTHSDHWLVKSFILLTRVIHPAALVPITLILLALAGMLLIGVFGLFLVRWLRRQYSQKKISDQSLLIDSIWLIFALGHATFLNPSEPEWIVSGLVAFLVYKLISVAGFSLIKQKKPPERIPQLLFLRVFSLGKRSQSLYQAITALWRLGGNPIFITGPDLLTSTVEPHDFLDFLGNKLPQRFTDSEETLKRQIERADTTPDHDGNYRIHDFFCYDNTWKMALSHLTQESDVVLMDLRSFSSKNAGCKFEIAELINHTPINQVVFVIDKTTNDGFMRQTMTNAWERMHTNSPNRVSPGKINLFEYTGKKANEIQYLLRALIAAANSAQQPLEVT
jgi:uncharacterized membrane protein (DUF2068 family)